jgi:integrase
MRQVLTTTKIRALARKSESSMTSDGGGLYFRKRKNSASWIIRRTRNKVAGFTTIGRYPDMSLAAARKALEQFGDHSAENMTVEELLGDWYDQNERSWRRPKQMEGYVRRLTEDDPHLVATNIHLVTLLTVRKSLKVYAKKHGNVAANRLMEILKNVFKHGVQVGYISHSPIVDLNRKVIGGIEKPRIRVLNDEEIRLVCGADRHSDLMRFLLLTGQRIRETQLATRSDVEDKRWFIPARNNKSDRDHWVSLSDQACAIIDRQSRRRRYIFNDTSATAVQAFLRRWCEKNDIGRGNLEQNHQGYFTPHDFRRTFATRLNELAIGPHVVEKILNHRLAGVMAVYNHADYADERVSAMQVWADKLQRVVGAEL